MKNIPMNTSHGTIGRLFVTAAALVLAGCTAHRPLHTQVDVSLGDEEAYRQFWQHTIKSVRHFGYELDRVDPAAGVITSKPETSKQWFEFWRNDTLGAEQVAEASLHTIRRQIRLTVQPLASKNEYLVDAIVNIQREERPERQITTPSNVIQAFTPRLPTEEKTASAAEGRVYWADLGRDPELEAALLRQIARWPGAKVIIPSDNEVDMPAAATQPAEEAPVSQTLPAGDATGGEQ